jgi:uncharacterized protein YjhX (UPF0386 family)
MKEQWIMENNYFSRILVVKANGGSVAVEKMVEGQWVTVDTFTEDGAWPMSLGISQTRFTPSNGAFYEVLN